MGVSLNHPFGIFMGLSSIFHYKAYKASILGYPSTYRNPQSRKISEDFENQPWWMAVSFYSQVWWSELDSSKTPFYILCSVSNNLPSGKLT